MKYVMVSDWSNHWDKLKGNSTYYSPNMLKWGMSESKLIDNTITIFLKRNKDTKEIEKAWQGRVYNIRSYKEKFWFSVAIDKEIIPPKKYLSYSVGWYFDDEEIFDTETNMYSPLFFSKLLETNDWKEFEELTYFLLKILGIHQIYKYERQRGLPDGFFKFENFAVIYDTTLEKNFFKFKHPQVNNFCSQLNKSDIIIGNREIPINNCVKNVWIITKSNNSKLIKKVGNIKVKEVPINSLIELYHKRLIKDMDESDFEKELEYL